MSEIRFRRIRGRIVPIKSAGAKIGNVATKKGPSKLLTGSKALVGVTEVIRVSKATASVGAVLGMRKAKVEPKRNLQALALGAAVADGVVSGSTFLGTGGLAFFGGQAAAIGLDLVSSSANVASYLGKGKKKERIRGAIRSEAINTIAGNAAFVGTLFAVPRSRKKIFEYGSKAFKFIAKKVVR